MTNNKIINTSLTLGILSIAIIILGIILSLLTPDIGFINIFRSLGIPISTIGLIMAIIVKIQNKDEKLKKKITISLILNSISLISILLIIILVFLFFSTLLFFK